MSSATELLRARAGRVDLVDVPDFLFAGFEGQGAPGGTTFQAGIGALFQIAYGVRFALRSSGVNEKVAPLESLWWPADSRGPLTESALPTDSPSTRPDAWRWRLLIRLPDAAAGACVEQVRRAALARHPENSAQLVQVRIANWREGLAVQTLHIGPYDAEPATIQMLHEFIHENGYRPAGHHHEIYLSDPRRSAPERLRTILRQPITTG